MMKETRMISFRRPEGHGLCLNYWLGVAAIITALLGGRAGFAAENVTLRDVTFQIGQTSYRAPQVEFIVLISMSSSWARCSMRAHPRRWINAWQNCLPRP
jgi:hypothetical protein